MVEHSGKLRVWRPAEIASLELREGTDFQHSYPRHWHDELYVTAITGGAGDFFFHGENHRATPGTMVVIPPGEVHSHEDPECGRSFRGMFVEQPALQSLALQSAPGSLQALPFAVTRDRRLFVGFLSLHAALERPSTRLERESALAGFFGLLEEILAEAAPKVPVEAPAAIRRSEQMLNECYSQEICLKQLAALSDLSPYHFHRVFSRYKGMPPHAYQIQLRILRAKALLKDRLPLAQVSAATGFADQSHFTRHFKRTFGFTPTQYSKNVLDA